MKTYCWKNLFLISLLAVGLYAFMEWLFIVTKPSFMDSLGGWQKFSIFLFTFSLLATLGAGLLAPLFLISRLPPLRKLTRWLILLGSLVPAFVLACLALLMLDNFTYTLFKFGIVTSQGLVRGLYAAGFIGALAYLLRLVVRRLPCPLEPTGRRKLNRPAILAALALAVMLPALVGMAGAQAAPRMGLQSLGAAVGELPDILYITGDGISATHVSVYDYERDTTPYTRELAETALVAENALTNAGNTTGSITSALTGKYATQTRVLYPPNVLRGSDAYVHLPGILRTLGYRSTQFAAYLYADAYTQNFQAGFDLANGRSQLTNPSATLFSSLLPSDDAYFITELYGRLIGRLKHIFFLETMVNPFEEVTTPSRVFDERAKIRHLLKSLKESKQPLFAHVHVMNTHGATFWPSKQVYSAGVHPSKQKIWDPDFYDDAILEFDRYVGQVIKELQRTGRFENTILIVSADHGMKWDNLNRIPLVIRFPHAQHAGRITANVQMIDIAPTILDYLDVAPPAEMRGRSLLSLPTEQRPIFTTRNSLGISRNEKNEFVINPEKLFPPFYQFTDVAVIYCQRYYRLLTVDRVWSVGELPGYVNPCPEDQLPTEKQAFDWIVSHLQENGFDTSSMTWPVAAP